HAGGGATAIAYRYDAAGRLILVRQLDAADLGTPIAYTADGQPVGEPLAANLGAVTNWGGGMANAWSGTLAGKRPADRVNLAFAVRESEMASTVPAPGARGAVILALETTLPADAEVEVVGAQIVGTAMVNGQVTRLLRVSEAGAKLIRLSGTGPAQLRISLAGDLNRDGLVDAIDSQTWQQSEAANDGLADLNGDGQIGSADRQILYANTGFRANQAPLANTDLAPLTTHAGLASRGALDQIAEDREGDGLFWRILGSTHGGARLTADGQSIVFTPEAGHTGEATVTVQADDGFTAGAPIELRIDVSSARLLQLHLAQLPALSTGQFARLQATADFADEKGVVITDAAYLTVSAAALGALGGTSPTPLQVDDSRDLVQASGAGPALLVVTRLDTDGRLIQAVAATNIHAAALPLDPDASDDESDAAGDEVPTVEPDVYPGTLTLVPGDTRQLKVHLIDPYREQPIDIHSASQTAFAGTPEVLETYTDPDTGETVELLIPATPAVYSGTRYLVSDASIASVSADGLVTAVQAGQVTIAVVHLASIVDDFGSVSQQIIGQTDIRLNVQAAQVTDDDPATATPAGITVAADEGGVVQAASGETVMIGAGALAADTVVSIRRIDLANLASETGMAVPEPALLQTLAAFRLDLGERPSTRPVQLAIPLQDDTDVAVGDEVLFLRRGTAPDLNGVLQDKWWIVDNGFVGLDAHGKLVAGTASPPYSGVNASGDLLCVKTTVNSQTGAVKVQGSGLNVFALTMNSLAIPMSAGFAESGLSGAGAATGLIGTLAGLSELFAISMDFGGVYQVLPLQKSSANGELTLSIASPPAGGSGSASNGSPTITAVQMLASGKLRLTLDQIQPGTAAGIPAQPAALRVWLSPEALTVDQDGNAGSELWSDQQPTRRDGMSLWQRLLDLEPLAAGANSMTLDLDLPERLAMGLHRVTVQRLLQTLDPAVPGTTRWLADGDPASVTVEGQTDFSVVTQDQAIRIFRNGQLLKEIGYQDASGNPARVNGSKTDQIAFSLDNRLMFVAGTGGEIHVIDTATLNLAATFSVGTANV
ncbi:MAG TPA: Ig-like domain-containing protein, partial [Accumulibacter sp.]|uniref:Ig-like domain-containing protein n=1 Tax=Accumulibacter sp. TaxID=2053492 RepID=UPI002B6D92C4